MSSSSGKKLPAEAGKPAKEIPVEVGYGAETHPAGEDFSHRAPWRKEQDGDSRRGPAGTETAVPDPGEDSAPGGEAA